MTDDMEFRLLDSVRLESLKKCAETQFLDMGEKECQNKQIHLKEYK